MSSSIVVTYTDPYSTECSHPSGKSSVITETHQAPGIEPKAYNPVELLVVAAAACSMSMIAFAAETHSFELEDLKTFATFEMERHPSRLSTLNLEIHMKDRDYSNRERKMIEKAVAACPVVLSLDGNIVKNISFIFE